MLSLNKCSQKDNVIQVHSEPIVASKSPKHTPTKSKKNHNKELSKKEDDSKDTDSIASSHQNVNKEHFKEQHNEVYREVTVVKETSSRDSKKSKKKNNFLAQLGK